MVEAIKTGLGGFLQRTQPKPIRFSLNLCTQMSTFAPPSSFNLTQGIVWLLVVFCNLFKVSVHPQTHTHSSIHKLKLNYSIEIWNWGKSKTRDTIMYLPMFRSPLGSNISIMEAMSDHPQSSWFVSPTFHAALVGLFPSVGKIIVCTNCPMPLYKLGSPRVTHASPWTWCF